ncbi:hypothetical protein [Acrocarpospora sp. B8E8]|uniref:hypothetical protein n=1 Tax=Acrocarpospora sp. B8E8 TaxID=3153572 RepID=UPI00325DD12B
MTTFADTHRGQRVELLDVDGDHWLPFVLLLEDPRPCHSTCCEAYAVRSGSGDPFRFHAAKSAVVRIVPRQRAAGESSSPRADEVDPDTALADPDPDAAYKAAQEDQINDDETGDQS